MTSKNDELRNQIDEKRKANGSLQSNAHSLELKIKTMERNEEEIIELHKKDISSQKAVSTLDIFLSILSEKCTAH